MKFVCVILFFLLASGLHAQDPVNCLLMGDLIKRIGGLGKTTGLGKVSQGLKDLRDFTTEPLGPPLNNSGPLGFLADSQNDLADELGNAFAAKCYVQIRMRATCGCSIKGTQTPYQSPNTNSIQSSPNTQTLWFAGDSLTEGGGAWDRYLPGFNIANIAASGSTSDDHFFQWNYCASQSQFGHAERTLQNPQPNSADKAAGSINVQNRRVFLIFGGNDLLSYKTTLQIFPLSPFEHQNMQEVLQRLGLHEHYGSFYDHNRNLVDGAYKYGLLSRNRNLVWSTTVARIAGMAEFRNAFISRPSAKNELWKRNPGLFSSIFFKSASGDNTWLSQRMIELASAVPVFTANRQGDYIPLHGVFVDPNAMAHGYPWVGNPYLWIYNGGPFHSELEFLNRARFPNDSIHPNPLGYIAWSNAILPYLEGRELNKNKVPFSYNDDCNHEPGPGAPDAAQFSFKPGFVSGPLATAEPPPLPAIDDNSMMLLIQVLLCFLTGFCH